MLGFDLDLIFACFQSSSFHGFQLFPIREEAIHDAGSEADGNSGHTLIITKNCRQRFTPYTHLQLVLFRAEIKKGMD